MVGGVEVSSGQVCAAPIAVENVRMFGKYTKIHWMQSQENSLAGKAVKNYTKLPFPC